MVVFCFCQMNAAAAFVGKTKLIYSLCPGTLHAVGGVRV